MQTCLPRKINFENAKRSECPAAKHFDILQCYTLEHIKLNKLFLDMTLKPSNEMKSFCGEFKLRYFRIINYLITEGNFFSQPKNALE